MARLEIQVHLEIEENPEKMEALEFKDYLENPVQKETLALQDYQDTKDHQENKETLEYQALKDKEVIEDQQVHWEILENLDQ